MYLQYYLKILEYDKLPDSIKKYLNSPSLVRLKKVGYFCGMDYASKNIYSFRENISRYIHSLTVALNIYKLTHDKIKTLAGLYHDISTPCFSHVIDYMNKDYQTQESTEEFTENILKQDKYFLNCLKEDNIKLEDIVDFKKYSIVDNNRPKLCADRLDGVILTGIGWTKNLSMFDIFNIINDICVFINEDNEEEIGFNTEDILNKVIEVSKSIDYYCHTKEDNYMMELLASITKCAINNNLITYEDLYSLNEEELFNILNNSYNEEIMEYLNKFYSIKKEDIPEFELKDVKIRKLNPLLNNKRFID